MSITSSQMALSDTSSIRFSTNSNTNAVVVGNTVAQGPMLSVSVYCRLQFVARAKTDRFTR